MSGLNSRLIAARIALVESKAKIEHDQQSSRGGKPHAATSDNDVIARLRAQYLELGVAASEMESRVGADHNAVIKVRKRMERLEAAIRDERERIAGAYPNEHKLAKARYDELAAALAELEGEAKTNSQAQVTLQDLETSAEALRSLYNSALQKFNEINRSQPQVASVQDARIITRAAPPAHVDAKKPLAALGGSIVLGLLLGAGAALARDLAGGALRTPGQVRDLTDIYCGIMPAVHPGRKQIALFSRDTHPGTIEEYVLDAPYSRFAETVRSIKVLVDAAHRASGDKVICVVSSVANEGKTTILTNLAAFMAATSTARVLVIDCDLHRRRLTTKLAPEASEGLIEALQDPSRLGELVWKRERSGMDVLPCALSARIPNAADLLGSPEMEKLLDVARASYDFILIEAPPIMSVVDIRMVERFVDRFVFVVEWGRTSRRLVQEALSEVAAIRDRLLCVVLNKADPVALRSIEAYKGARFGERLSRVSGVSAPLAGCATATLASPTNWATTRRSRKTQASSGRVGPGSARATRAPMRASISSPPPPPEAGAGVGRRLAVWTTENSSAGRASGRLIAANRASAASPERRSGRYAPRPRTSSDRAAAGSVDTNLS